MKKINNQMPIAIAIITFFLVFGYTYSLIFYGESTPELTIYKEECRNETLVIFEGKPYRIYELEYEISDYIKPGLRERYRDLGCDVLEKHDVLGAFLPCMLLKKDLDDMENIWWNLVEAQFEGIDKLNKTLIQKRTEETCEPVIVEEIEYQDGVYCDEIEDGYKGFCFHRNTDLTKTISKQDLNISWLDENCECAAWRYSNKDPCLKSNETEEDCDYTRTCSKYKYEDYTIEVKW